MDGTYAPESPDPVPQLEPGKPVENDFSRRLREKLQDELGENIRGLLQEPDVFEVRRNPGGLLWVKRRGQNWQVAGRMSDDKADLLIRTVGSALGSPVRRESPLLEGELPYYRYRFQAAVPPSSESPAFTIRVPPKKVFTLQEYVDSGVMSQAQRQVLTQAVDARRNILVVGGTGSGKTTLCNAIIDYLAGTCGNDVLLTIEDTRELQCKAPNLLSLRTSDYADHHALLKAALRFSPDRIVLGEVRGKEAYVMLQAWNTGHPGGVCTLHANDAESAPLRLHGMLRQAIRSPDPADIIATVNLIVVISKTALLPSLTQIATVTGFDRRTRTYQVASITT